MNLIKKGAFIFAFFLLIILARADAFIGVSPASYQVDFQPGLKQVFHFDFLQDNDYQLKISAEGDLAKYVTLSTTSLGADAGGVNALLQLPRSIEIPGRHDIYISASQEGNGASGVSLVGKIRGDIKVDVPFPGKYATIDFSSTNVNRGEPVKFSMIIHNLGKEIISVDGFIYIYDQNKASIEKIPASFDNIVSQDSISQEFTLNTSSYNPGKYTALALLSYGGESQLKSEIPFRIGELAISIVNYSNDLTKNKINRFDVKIESLWNDPIENVYATVSILGYPITFKTPSVDLKGFEQSTLTGYFDTTSIQEDNFRARIEIDYANKTTEKYVNINFKREYNYLLIGLVAAIAIALIAVITLIAYLIRVRRKIGRKENKKSKGK